MARKKKYTLQNIHVERYAAEGKCVARVNDKVIFIEGAVPGDIVDLFVHKNKKDWAEARVTRLVEPSGTRVTPFCAHFGTCGGCKWQMLPYDKQIAYKEEQVKDQLRRIGHVQVAEHRSILGCSETHLYRNKLEFTFSNKRFLSGAELNNPDVSPNHPSLGFHAPGLFDKVIPIEVCHLQAEPTNAIRNFVRNYALAREYSFYDHRAHTGFLRNLMIRVATTGQVLVNLVFAEDRSNDIQTMMQAIQTAFPTITSLHYTVNTKFNDSLYDQDIRLFSGTPYIEEKLEDFTFRISPKSFFQTNTQQATVLYSLVRELADLKGTETVYDLYCGTGSIGIFLSPGAKKIIGVETVADAIEDAKINAQINGIEGAEFYAGDVIDVCNDAFFEQHGHPDIVIIDPPRAGCHDKLLQKLLQIGAPRILYVSCNPATQARDLAVLQADYTIAVSQPVDLFPHTHHIENVALLERKK
ncbi:MAG: 23S rRNA (uracil(1939)-C(5))-methyltransferase RlmD [Chitinophagaceae bacterium]|nr:23S rRNA (uracil(1939)-C(5))-methyltransferase RlmD [Chitinophagaceae bacterium]